MIKGRSETRKAKTTRGFFVPAGSRLDSFELVFLLWILTLVSQGVAQRPDITEPEKSEPVLGNESPTTMFPHSAEGRFWLSGQANFVYQTNPEFYAAYSGEHSFRSNYDKANGRIMTLYGGFQFTKLGEVLVSAEEAGGLGLSSALGIAAFPNLDAVRDPTLSEAPYLARVMYHQVFSLTANETAASRGPLSTFSQLPSRRLELRIGKFAITDFFDTNSVGGDSHLQFLNWAVDQNGAYDFTADARGYTWGVMVEYQSPKWGARFAEALMPGPNNGGPLVWNLHKANTSNMEFELHRGLLPKKEGTIRLLAYVNNANMGIYRYANQQYLEGRVAQPDIGNHSLQVTTKYGFGINMEQALSKDVTAYGRFGWDNGKTESWSFTEIDQTFSGGVGVDGHAWRRNNDRAGIAFATNGIAKDHILYLSYGGLGFVLGDGGLNYGRENLLESYYTAHIWRGIYLGPDIQYVVHPGYNEARGPVVLPSFRVHVEF
jgi:hypothetical protein